MKTAIFVPVVVSLFAQTAWPMSFLLSRYNLLTEPLYVFIAGVVCLIFSVLGPLLVLRRCFSNVDPLMYVFSVFTWSCMIDLGVWLELDGYISNFIGFYFVEGEPYLKTAHGTIVSLWDGTAHLLMYLGCIRLYSARKSHREVGLYWAGSLINSMIVLIPGGIAGNHPFKMSILLNVPYILFPMLAAFKFFNERPPQSQAISKFKPIWRRPIDLMFVLYFVAASGVAVFRGVAVLGGNAEAMKYYLKNVEPYLTDPSNFPKLQILIYEHCFLAYYLAAIYGLVYPGCHWMTDWSLIHGGAAAQAQYSHIIGSVHHRTAKALHAPMAGTPGLLFWTINIALAIVPQLFAWRCMSDTEMFGRTYNVKRAELKKHSTSNDHPTKKLK